MKPAKIILPLLLLCGALLWVARWNRAEPAPKPAVPVHRWEGASPPPVVKLRPPTPSLPDARGSRIVAQPPRARPEHAKPEDNVIEFQVVEGQAVAYGDLLLGTPDDPTVVRGSYEAPKPQLWDRPEIPYAIAPSLPNRDRVVQAMELFRRGTAIRFVPYDGQQDALLFEPGEKDCLSLLGKQGGVQPIKLSPKCGPGEIAHEIMHALGFVHEQSRTDREPYIEILWNNIERDFQPQYEMVPESFMEASKGAPFDYHSIMLYKPSFFATNPGLKTMQSRTEVPISPLAEELSASDVERLNRLYPAP